MIDALVRGDDLREPPLDETDDRAVVDGEWAVQVHRVPGRGGVWLDCDEVRTMQAELGNRLQDPDGEDHTQVLRGMGVEAVPTDAPEKSLTTLRQQMIKPSLGWVWLLLIAIALLAWAHVTRYQIAMTEKLAGVVVWDRWRHRFCYFRGNRQTWCEGLNREWTYHRFVNPFDDIPPVPAPKGER